MPRLRVRRDGDGYGRAMEPSQSQPLDALLGAGTSVMVGTATASGEFEFRPLTVAAVHGDEVDILVDTTAEWARRFDGGEPVLVTLSNDRDNTWASLHGTASMSTDAERIDELWNPAAEAYFDDGRDSPGIAVMQIDVTAGRYWSAPSGRLGSLVSMVRAAIGDPGDGTEHGDVAL
jgi:general stress protein 26